MSDADPTRGTVLALGGYVLWLLAVLLLVVGNVTSLPVLPGVRAGVVIGTVVFVGIGVVRLGSGVLARVRG